jgi:hypothetical protein
MAAARGPVWLGQPEGQFALPPRRLKSAWSVLLSGNREGSVASKAVRLFCGHKRKKIPLAACAARGIETGQNFAVNATKIWRPSWS